MYISPPNLPISPIYLPPSKRVLGHGTPLHISPISPHISHISPAEQARPRPPGEAAPRPSPKPNPYPAPSHDSTPTPTLYPYPYPTPDQATEAAAPATRPLPWQNSTAALVALYRSSPALLATKGVMTWSVGHDWSNGWKWVRAVKKIWGDQTPH